MENITSSLEDYLEVICNYTDNKTDIRAIDISKKLKVSRASVTEALDTSNFLEISIALTCLPDSV